MGIALVDRDQAQAKHPDWVITWPVSMVENLLLDSDAIWEVLEPHREATGLVARSAVAERLMEIAREQRADEIRLRVKLLSRTLPSQLVRCRSPKIVPSYGRRSRGLRLLVRRGSAETLCRRRGRSFERGHRGAGTAC